MQTFGSPDNPDPLVGRVLLRGLRLVERLGATSEGPLYRGQYSSAGPPVAVTLLRLPADSADPSGTAILSDRHWQQLRRACQIQHPNVAGLMDVGESPDGIVYAVAELLTGERVSDILAVSAGIPPPQAVDICVQVAEGLRAAHAAGVVHGSVSPQTVLVTGGGEHLTVKLIGFDFARHPALADAGAETPWADDQIDPTDDIVGVGVLLHCLLTGVPPDGERKGRAMPPALRRIIDRCLGVHGRHYPTMGALADDLARQAAEVVRPPPRLRRPRPMVVGALAASVIVLAAGVWLGWTRIHEKSVEARSEVGTRTLDPVPESQPPPAASAPRRSANSIAAGPRRQPIAPDVRGGESSTAPARGTATPAQDPSAALSPFRRSHPWAAEPRGRVYFRSSCPQALRATDLLYFRTEAEARATGRTPSPDPRCS